jgi:hypothetical protein
MAVVEDLAGAFYDGFPQASADADVALHLELDGDHLDRKVTAMRVHATQSAAVAERLGESAFRSWWRTESYVEVGRRGLVRRHPCVTHRPARADRVASEELRELLLAG